MDDWLKTLRDFIPGDRGLRLLVAGGTALLFLIVIVDSFGNRGRAIEAQRALQAQADSEDRSTATVPSVYRVPTDLASQVALARAQAEADELDALAEAEMTEEATEEMAEAEVTEEATEEMAEADAAEEATEEMAEAEMTEEATEEVAEAETAEEATEDMAEAEVAEEAAEEMAEQDATEDATEEMAETEVTEEATEEMADAASEDDTGLALLASADIGNGENVWRQCRACHVHDAEQNRGGPHLVDIIGRDVAAAEGWRYSRALSEHGGVWTVESLLAWLENPDSYIPGNQMAFRGLRNEQDRIDVLGFLNQ